MKKTHLDTLQKRYKKMIVQIEALYPVIAQWGVVVGLYTIIATTLFVMTRSFSLEHFDNHIVSQATMMGVDVGLRVGAYVTSVLFAMLFFTVSLVLISFFTRTIDEDVGLLLHRSSFIAIVFGLLFLCTGVDIFPHIFFFTPVLHLLILLNHAIEKKTRRTFVFSSYYEWITAAALLVTISTVLIVGNVFGLGTPRLFLLSAVSLYTINLCVLFLFFFRLWTERLYARMARTSLPFFLLPFVYFVGTETAFFLHNRFDVLFAPRVVILFFAIVLLLTSSWIFFQQRRKADAALDVARFLRWYMYPALIFAVGIVRFYNPLLPFPTDLFEPANPALLIQQFIDFGKIPFIDSFNAHGFSDAFFGFIYTVIHGLDHTQWQYYDFLQFIVIMELAYIVLAFVMRSSLFAVLTILCAPYFVLFFHPNIVLSLFFMWLLFWLVRKHSSVFVATIFFLSFPLIFFWRIDSGVSVIFTGCSILVLSALLRHISFQWKQLALGAVCATAISVFFFVLMWLIADFSPALLAQDFFHIFQSDQTFGYGKAFLSLDGPFFLLYVGVPLLCIAINIYLLVTQHHRPSKQEMEVQLLIHFLTIFHVVYLSRALVRHTLIEETAFMSLGVGLLIVGIFFAYLFRPHQHKETHHRFALFLFVTVFFTIAVIPSTQRDQFPPLLDNASDRLASVGNNTIVLASGALPQGRSGIRPETRNLFDETLAFTQTQLLPEQTFFDFSNTPMLYYLTARENPIFTNHQMIMHDEYLQQRTIEQLQQKDVPFVVFANTQIVGGPYNLDGVPFFFRYFDLAEYVYQQYSPALVLDGREIWFRNDWTPPAPLSQQRLKKSDVEYNASIGLIPFFWGAYGQETLNAQTTLRSAAMLGLRESLRITRTPQQFSFDPLSAEEKQRGVFIVIKGKTKGGKKQDLLLTYREDDGEETSVQFSARPDGKMHQYVIRVSAQYPWMAENPDVLTLRTEGGAFELQEISIHSAAERP